MLFHFRSKMSGLMIWNAAFHWGILTVFAVWESYGHTIRSCCIRVYGAGLHSGIIHYDDVKNQLHDLSGITEGAFEGNGRGRQACTWNLELNCLHTAAYEWLVDDVVVWSICHKQSHHQTHCGWILASANNAVEWCLNSGVPGRRLLIFCWWFVMLSRYILKSKLSMWIWFRSHVLKFDVEVQL